MHRTTVRESDSSPFSGRPEFPLQPMTRKQMVLLLVRVSFLLDERRTFLIILALAICDNKIAGYISKQRLEPRKKGSLTSTQQLVFDHKSSIKLPK